MMMSRPAPETEEESSPSFAVKPAQTPSSQVEDLERRLAMLGGVSSSTEAPPDLLGSTEETKDSKLAAVPQAPAASGVSSGAVKGGKSALLARIMAAQEKTKQAQTKTEAAKPPPASAPDLLMDLDAPNAVETPPPTYDTSLLPPPSATAASSSPPPPSFEMLLPAAAPPTAAFAPPPPTIEAVAPPPPFEAVASPPPAISAPSAPVFQPSAPSFDLLSGESHPPPPPLEDVEAIPPPPPPAVEEQIDDDVLAALDPEERDALLAEQRQIMEQIEKDKVNSQASGAAARAMAFDQRSNAAVAQAAAAIDGPSSLTAPPAYSAAKKSSSSNKKKSKKKGQRTIDLGAGEEVPLHGQERTKEAIKDGTAVKVQCMNCQNWMQVTGHATLMFCPVCQVVSPVMREGSAEVAGASPDSQLDADAKLAQQLQDEEYKKAAGDGQPSSSRSATRSKPKSKPKTQEEQSWYDWLVGNNPKESSRSRAASSGNIGTMPSQSSSVGGGLVSAQTGTERSRSRSYDESESLMPTGGARVAQQKGMFACVTDSIATATTAMYTDQDGNVHGVDSSSLLAMPQVSRQRD